MKRLIGLLVVALAPAPGLLTGQDSESADPPEIELEFPPLVTDRPDQTESPSVVPPGYFQLEMGWVRGENDDDGVKVETDEVAQALIRIGVIDRVELRLGFAGYIGEDVTVGGVKSKESGAGDAAIGFKVALLPERGPIPETALLGAIGLPTGAVSSERADPSARLAFAHTLHERLSLSYNMGVAWESEETLGGSRHTLSSFEWTMALGVGITDRLGAFLEFFGDTGLSRSGGPRNSFDSGVTFLLQPNLQLDLSGGVGLSEDADDWFVSGGFSYRFPR